MPGTATTVCLSLFAATALAASPDYFPLHPGNVWIYQGSGTRAETTLTLQILKTGEFNGKGYSLLEGLPGKSYWLRSDDAGTLVAYDPERNQEQPWYAFQSPLGQEYQTWLPGVCCGRAVISSRNARYKGAIGEFDYALEVRFPGTFQVGTERELFLPYVGMIHRSQATGGPSYGAYDLIYARLGGVTVVSAPELSFSLTLDNSAYTANLMPPIDPQTSIPLLTARLTLRNTANPIALTFPSGQSFDFVIRNEKGEIVYRWSDGKAFTMAIRYELFGPGEKHFLVQVRLAGPDKRPLPLGRYTAEGWLTTVEGKAFAASVAFDIRHVS